MIQETVANNHNTQNSRIYERNIPSKPLQPYLDVRAVSTKYSFLPIVDPRTPAHVPMKVESTYNSKYTFNPDFSERRPRGKTNPLRGFTWIVLTSYLLRSLRFCVVTRLRYSSLPGVTKTVFFIAAAFFGLKRYFR